MTAKFDSTHRAARVSVAPMMAWTTPAQRYFMRQITRSTLLYTEMVTTHALIHGETARFLAHHPDEHPLALQLGGNDPATLAHCAELAEHAGFDEVNLNIGCPSDRVKNGAFGACLMAEPNRVADCVAAMKARVAIPVTVKTRIGIDHFDDYAFLQQFAGHVADAGADRLIVHARKAWLSGLSPRENREKPPLDYARVHRLAADFRGLPIVINGGLVDLDSAETQLEHVHGVMIGRAAYQTPYLMADVDRRFFASQSTAPCRARVVEAMRGYIADRLAHGERLHNLVKPMLGLYHAEPGGRAWRRVLSEHAQSPSAGVGVLDQALEHVTAHNSVAA